MDESGIISVEKLFKESKLKLGISVGRSYTPKVDRIINENLNLPQIVKQYKKDIVQRPVTLMLAQRGVDYVIEYPHVVTWIDNNNILKQRLRYIPIKESDKYILSYVGCSKNEWGKKIINKINPLLDGKYTEQYKDGYQQYLSPEELKRHNNVMEQIFPDRTVGKQNLRTHYSMPLIIIRT